jgi:hypothetical protein
MTELHTTNYPDIKTKFGAQTSNARILCDIGNCLNTFDTKIWDCNLRESRPICNGCLKTLDCNR